MVTSSFGDDGKPDACLSVSIIDIHFSAGILHVDFRIARPQADVPRRINHVQIAATRFHVPGQADTVRSVLGDTIRTPLVTLSARTGP